MTPDLPPDAQPPPPEVDARRVLEILDFHLVNSPLGVVEWNHEFRVRSWSGRAEELFGWRADEVLGKHPDDWRFYTKAGGVVVCEWYNSVLTDDEGRLVSVLSLIHDVTHRKAAEEQVRQLQKMEFIGQLTGGIAHDFNKLLTVILGLGDLLAEDLEAQPNHRELVIEMMEAATRGATLTRDLLSFARQQPLEPRATDIDALLQKLAGLLRRSLGEHVELDLVPGTDGRPAEVDPGQLESAILNLCLNARDATGEGGRLTVETEVVCIDGEADTADEDIAPGDYVVVATLDTGVGILPEHRAKVFDPFFTTKEPGRGSGLGLSMVYGFAKQSRGEVKIYSEVGRGTTVRLYLPVAGTTSQSRRRRHRCTFRPAPRRFSSSRTTAWCGATPSYSCGRWAIAPSRWVMVRPPSRSWSRAYTSGCTENAIALQGRGDPGVLLLSKPYQRGSLARKIREAIDGGHS